MTLALARLPLSYSLTILPKQSIGKRKGRGRRAAWYNVLSKGRIGHRIAEVDELFLLRSTEPVQSCANRRKPIKDGPGAWQSVWQTVVFWLRCDAPVRAAMCTGEKRRNDMTLPPGINRSIGNQDRAQCEHYPRLRPPTPRDRTNALSSVADKQRVTRFPQDIRARIVDGSTVRKEDGVDPLKSAEVTVR